MGKGEASIEQWSHELETLRKTYSESALREGIQRSLKGAAADTIHIIGPGASLDTIIKKFSIIYVNVKSYDLLMRDLYRADLGVEKSVTSFPTRVEGLLSQIRDKAPDQIPLEKEQNSSKIGHFMAVAKAYGIVSNTAMLMLRCVERQRMRI